MKIFILHAIVGLLNHSITTTASPHHALSPRDTNFIPPPPKPEPIELVRLPLPPGISSNTPGSCDERANPRRTGCMRVKSERDFQSGSFLPDGKHVLALVPFIGAPPAPEPASIYNGSQIIIIKTDGTYFPNGDSWKCITCGIPVENAIGRSTAMDYPQAFIDGKRILFGTNIADCGNHLLTSEECTPDKTHIYPIRWNTSPDGSGSGGAIRELRLHPDNVHLGFSSFTTGAKLGQFGYFSRLQFNPKPTTGLPLAPRYDLLNVYRMYRENGPNTLSIRGDQLYINESAVVVGELRGFSGRGDEIVYVGNPVESSNLDVFAANMQTGRVRRITAHPEYVDPIDHSPDGRWWAIMDTRDTDRQMFLSGMRNVPPITDLVTTLVTSATRNNGQRRFFVPYLLDNAGDRQNYYGQKINGPGFSAPGSGDFRDPEWNGQADPRWSPDSTQLVYWEAHVEFPACGGANPLPCYSSKEPDGKDIRIILAKFTGRKPSKYVPVAPVPDEIPWGELYVPGSAEPERTALKPGRFTLQARVSGYADVRIDHTVESTEPNQVAVTYHNYSDDGITFLNGWENVTSIIKSPTLNHVDWYSDLVQVGSRGIRNTKKTSVDGFHLDIDVLTNFFNANGTMTTTIGDKVYKQPLNNA
ncbi:saponin hydrolase precursor [Colletotrichum truncatum]|uniref:Saponin hydrolase n=1 Tax=Colletotrichum truncatum TaxID=5467 RepID=A0ACC3YVC9_COLTU|nr:saponin hydrolase precursor [Colletotrichum truncatum]KAF6781583.1 saponin hydrolase precursor [Colletotrichum truncatum]